MSSSLIGWIVSLLFIVVLVGGFLVGFWRGLKKSMSNLVLSLIAVIVAFFVTPSITSAILKIKVSGGETLNEMLVNLLRDNKDIKLLLTNNANLDVLIQNLPNAVLNTIIFLFVTVAIEFVAYIIFKILNIAFFKGAKKGKLFGGLVGLAKTFVVMIIAFMPLAGLIGLANNLTQKQSYGISTTVKTDLVETNGIIGDKLPEQVTIVVSGLENNMLIKCSSLFGLDNAMFDYYSKVKVDGKNVKMREEIQNIYGLADFGYQLSRQNLTKVDYTKIDYDKLTRVAKDFTESGLFDKVLSEVISDLIVNYKSYSFLSSASFSDILDELGVAIAQEDAGEYFRSDILNIVASIKELGEGGVINEVMTKKDSGASAVLTSITSEEYLQPFENGVKKVLSLNLVQDAATTLANKLVTKLSNDIDKIGVNGSQLTKEDWDEISTQLVTIAKDFGEISKTIDIKDVISHPDILIDKDKNYDIADLLSKLGNMFDKVRANKLLQTSEGTPVIDKLLTKYKLELPKDSVIASGSKKTISNYKEYFEFISDPVITLRDEGIYELYKNRKSTNDFVKQLTNKLGQAGKRTLLSDIILPLYQVEPTKTYIEKDVVDLLKGTISDIGELKTYNDWKGDLGYLTDMLVALDSVEVAEDKTMLDSALEGDFSENFFDVVNEQQLEDIITPMLKAKSTTSFKTKLFNQLKVKLDSLTGSEVVMNVEGVTFDGEGNQTAEIVAVLKSFLSVINTAGANESLSNVLSESLGNLLENMKANAYREGEEGIFKSSFVKVVDKFKLDYSDAISYIENDEDLMRELGITNFNEESYGSLDYRKLLEIIDRVSEM